MRVYLSVSSDTELFEAMIQHRLCHALTIIAISKLSECASAKLEHCAQLQAV
jgi:hypothetical protein